MNPFHLAIPVRDLPSAEAFYADLLGCKVGRRDTRWIDFNFFGHQLTIHLCDEQELSPACNEVDEHAVPARHFGVVLNWPDWESLSKRLQQLSVQFYIEPTIRFAGKPGEQGTFFIQDPSDNFLEFKSFRDMGKLFSVE